MHPPVAPSEVVVKRLGGAQFASPLQRFHPATTADFDAREQRILLNIITGDNNRFAEPVAFECAGPHQKLYFDPSRVTAAIVSCGGLCPGVNNVIRALTYTLLRRYKAKLVLGARYGYEGLNPAFGHELVELDIPKVGVIHTRGGTFLGSSRGQQPVEVMVDQLQANGIDMLFTIGGDGTLRGAHAIQNEITRRGLNIAVVGIPKTIDNDIGFIDKSFGTETAFSTAQQILANAHNEAYDCFNGIALVKLMGRDSGFIAANAALASPDVNYVLIPEMHFALEGENGLLNTLQRRLAGHGHALIVVAEGAGQNLFSDAPRQRDASGNVLHHDIGPRLKSELTTHLRNAGIRHTIKYIDPSYIIRSAPANANDSKFCNQLAQNAVHAAMAGRTDCVIGFLHNHFTVMPIPLAVRERMKVNLQSNLWFDVLEATGQPAQMYD